MINLLALSGSLRAQSSNAFLLEAIQILAPAGIHVELYTGIGTLPHFNPDMDGDGLPAKIVTLRQKIASVDGILISCPEYARGIPGSFKNALDWLVSGSELPGKPVALFNASPRAWDAQAALRLVLRTMSAYIVEEASMTVPMLGAGLDTKGIVTNMELAPRIVAKLNVFAEAIRLHTAQAHES